MDEYGYVTAPRTVRIERELPGPVERVWAYLAEPEERGKWLARGPIELREGGAVEMRFHDSQLTQHDEEIPEAYKKYEGHPWNGEVTRCEPPRVLALTWQGESGVSLVTFELSERGAKTRLVVTHERLISREHTVSVSAGWHLHLDVLEEVLSECVPAPYWERYQRMIAEYEGRVPKDPKE